MDEPARWEAIYTSSAPEDRSWTEGSPVVSLRLLDAYADPARGVVDVGAGTSTLVDHLIARGWSPVTVVDLSAAALDVVDERLGPCPSLELLIGDVTAIEVPARYGAWHDRAVLHFLVDEDDQAAYADAAVSALVTGGVAVIGCFAPDGPERCSGLEVVRRDAEALAELFGERFELLASEVVAHTTPWGASQPFTWVVLRRRSDAD